MALRKKTTTAETANSDNSATAEPQKAATKTSGKKSAAKKQAAPEAAPVPSAAPVSPTAEAKTGQTNGSHGKSKTNGSTPKKANITPTHDDVAFRAWEIWNREGCPDGQHVDHWLQAKEELGYTESA